MSDEVWDGVKRNPKSFVKDLPSDLPLDKFKDELNKELEKNDKGYLKDYLRQEDYELLYKEYGEEEKLAEEIVKLPVEVPTTIFPTKPPTKEQIIAKAEFNKIVIQKGEKTKVRVRGRLRSYSTKNLRLTDSFRKIRDKPTNVIYVYNTRVGKMLTWKAIKTPEKEGKTIQA